jgi:hypothetical protein
VTYAELCTQSHEKEDAQLDIIGKITKETKANSVIKTPEMIIAALLAKRY